MTLIMITSGPFQKFISYYRLSIDYIITYKIIILSFFIMRFGKCVFFAYRNATAFIGTQKQEVQLSYLIGKTVLKWDTEGWTEK